jgi:hypothetical protein
MRSDAIGYMSRVCRIASEEQMRCQSLGGAEDSIAREARRMTLQ